MRAFGRETFIALRARRQAHQIATAILNPPIDRPIAAPRPSPENPDAPRGISPTPLPRHYDRWMLNLRPDVQAIVLFWLKVLAFGLITTAAVNFWSHWDEIF